MPFVILGAARRESGAAPKKLVRLSSSVVFRVNAKVQMKRWKNAFREHDGD
jgi:hypothetical protein